MPSLTPAGALLAMSAQDDDKDRISVDGEADDEPISVLHPPWCWPAWQQRTGRTSAPFSSDNSPWGSDAFDTVSIFVSNFWALQESEQISYITRNRQDNDRVGRIYWLDFINAGWGPWKINATVDAALAERGFDPYSVMKRMKVAKVCC